MSNPTSSPSTGYKTESLLTNIVKTELTSAVKKQAITFASTKGTNIVNKSLGTVGLANGISTTAVNKAVQEARSASEKLNGALGGKLSSVLGSGAAGLAEQATKQIKNLATGAVSQVSSMVQNKLGSALQSALGSSVGGMMGDVVAGLSDTASKNLAGASLVKGFLSSGPKDNSLVVDVYGVSDNGVLNGLADKVSGFASDAFNEIRQSPNLVTDLVSMVASGGENWSLSKEGLADRVLSSLGGQTGVLNGLSNGLKSTIVNGTGLPENIYDTAVALIGGESIGFNAGQMSNARDVFSLVNRITNSSEMKGFFDIGSESALMAGVMREAIALGVPDAIDVLVEKAKDDQIAYNALYANMQVAVEHSDLDTINLMVDKVGANAFVAQIPTAVPMLLESYRLPANASNESYDNELAALKTVLGRLRPDWGIVKRDGTAVSDLTAFAGLSDDARKLLMRDPDLQIPVLIGKTYQSRMNMVEQLQSYYPLVPLSQVA